MTVAALHAKLAARRRVLLARNGARAAAVLVPIVAAPSGLALLCFERTHSVLEHKGEICFPGGSVDPGDADVVDAALREAHEELGIKQSEVEVLGLLDEVSTSVSNYVIAPVVGYIATAPQIVPDAREVARPIAVQIAELVERGAQVFELAAEDGTTRSMYAYDVGDDRIWGATARIIHGMLSLWLGDEETS